MSKILTFFMVTHKHVLMKSYLSYFSFTKTSSSGRRCRCRIVRNGKTKTNLSEFRQFSFLYVIKLMIVKPTNSAYLASQMS